MSTPYNQHTVYTRTPASCPSVEAITFEGPESGALIVEWIEAICGRGAAICEDGFLRIFAEEFDAATPVPQGWVVYRKFFGQRFHILPPNIFNFRYEVRP